jgi:hypothetical protein
MQRVKNARDQLNSQAQWIQLGLLTASILTPIVRRWNELRAMDHRRALREEAAPPPRESQSDDAPIPLSSIIFWVVGVGVGIIAAGVGTYLFLKRRMAANQEEPLLPLPFPRPDGTASSSRLAGANHGWQGEMATSTGGHDQTPVAGGLETAGTADSTSGPEDDYPDRLGTQASAPGEPDIEMAAVIGNIRTLAYHFTDDANLPDEDNRVYFSSEEEARLAGFHHVTDEIPSSENSAVE